MSVYSFRHKNPCLTYKFWDVRQPGRAFVVKFSKPGADDPWYNVCVYVPAMGISVQVVLSLAVIQYVDSVYVVVCAVYAQHHTVQ